MILKNQLELNDQIRLKYYQFSGKDFGLACKCCNTFFYDQNSIKFFELLDKFQNFLTFAVIGKNPKIRVTNCYRCEKRNQKVGGVSNSAHMKSIAADIYTNELNTLDLLKNAVVFSKFSGIGYYPDQGFIHVDIRERPETSFWIKKKNHPYEYFPNLMELLKAVRSG